MNTDAIPSMTASLQECADAMGHLAGSAAALNKAVAVYLDALPTREETIASVIAELRDNASPQARATLPLDAAQFIRDSFVKLERLNPDDGYFDTATKLLTMLDPWRH